MRSFLRRVQALLRRERLETELAEELETHRLLLAERLKRDGMEGAAAEAASRRTMGNMTLAREDARAAWMAPWLESVWQDLRYGVRHLLAHPAFTITTAATLLLATVLNTSFFTLFNATVLRTWPVPDAGRVVIVHSRSAEPGGADGMLYPTSSSSETGPLLRRIVCDLGQRQSRLDDVAEDGRFHLLRPVRVRERELFPGLRIPMAIRRSLPRPTERMLPGPSQAFIVIVGAGLSQRGFRRRSPAWSPTPTLVHRAADDHRRRHGARTSSCFGVPSPMNSEYQ